MAKFVKARREKLKGAIGIMGPSGSGKTIGSLFVAYGMVNQAYPDLTEEEKWEKIAFVDTEHRRSLVYVGMQIADVRIGEYLHMNLTAPYTVQAYQEAVTAAKEAGAYVVILDSITHAWEGSGGLLDLQQSRGGNFQAWREVNKPYKDFVSTITGERDDIHVISTMRLKQDYAMGTGDDGKLKVEKLGLKPVQRDSLEYEFQVVFSVGMNHVATVSKDNSGLFHHNTSPLSPEIGAALVDWLDKGVDVAAEREKRYDEYLQALQDPELDKELQEKVKAMEEKAGMTVADMREQKTAWLVKAHQNIFGGNND